MNVIYLEQAVENLDQAAYFTPERTEREAIIKVARQARKLLRKRGVFIGEPDFYGKIPRQNKT